MVYCMRIRLWYIWMYCYFMELWCIVSGHDFCGFMRNVLGLEDIVFLVCGILQLLQVGTCWVKDWGVVIRNLSEMYCWNDQSHLVVTRIWDQSMALLWFWDSSRNCRGPYYVWEDGRCICIVFWCTHVKIANRAKNSKKINFDNN